MAADTCCLLGVGNYATTEQQASLAKHWVRRIFADLVDGETLYDLSLCTVELFDNGRKHGRPGGSISIAAYLTDDAVRLEVANEALGLTVPHVTDNLLTEWGHGLKIVAALAMRWGIYQNSDQHQIVWCEFAKIERISLLSTTTDTSEPDRLMTPAEVAAAFRVDPKTVTRWAKAGKLSSIKTLGGHRRYREADIRALLSQSLLCDLHQRGRRLTNHAYLSIDGSMPQTPRTRGTRCRERDGSDRRGGIRRYGAAVSSVPEGCRLVAAAPRPPRSRRTRYSR